MSFATTYTCDFCGNAQESREQFWQIGLVLEHYPPKERGLPSLKADICRDCVDKFQLLFALQPKSKDSPPPSTPAQRIGELIEEMIDEGIEWRRSQ